VVTVPYFQFDKSMPPEKQRLYVKAGLYKQNSVVTLSFKAPGFFNP
jgi:hypothetical protein